MSATKPPSSMKGNSRKGLRRPSPEAESAPIMGLRQVGMADLQGDAVAYASVPPIEGLNREILALLQEDGRMPFSSIARTLGISEGTVRSRVAQMRKANLIHFITVVNPRALGYTAWSMLGIKVARGASADEVARYFRDRPEVVYVMRVAARFDLLARSSAARPTSCASSWTPGCCYGSDDIAEVEPMMGLGLYKSLLKWDRPPRCRRWRREDGKARPRIALGTKQRREGVPQ